MKRTFLKRLFCTALVALMSLITVAQDFSGDWKGNIEVAAYNLKIGVVLHIEQNENGITATIDVPEQKAFGLKSQAKIKGEKLELTFPDMGASYEAKLIGNTLDGTYSQMGFSMPLKLTREVPAVADNGDEDWINDSLLSVFDNIQLEGVEVTAQRQLIKQEVDRT